MSTNQDGTAEVETVHDEQDASSILIADRASQEVESRYGSITHPYRSLLKDTSFSRCHRVTAPMCSAETYTRSLLGLGHGTPLWDPIGNVVRPKPHVKSSIMIGDVGYFDTRGDFAYYFNIFLSPTDPAQYVCPQNFQPLLPPPQPSELVTNGKYFPPGTTLVSPGVEVSCASTSPLDISFTVRAREGGILILPDGASREDMVETARVRDYVLKHARNWYKLMNPDPHRCVMCSNGQLCVVTGHDKATSWAASVALPYNRTGKIRTVRYQEDDWPEDMGMDCQTSHVTANYDIDHCALFLRTMRFALSIQDWTEHLLDNDPPVTFAFYYMPTVPIFGLRAFYRRLKERVFKQAKESVSGCDEVTFHPLQVILQFLLVESPLSNMAVIEDSVWNAVASETDGNLSSTTRALVKLLESHEISTQSEYVTLIPPLGCSSKDGTLSTKPGGLTFRISNRLKNDLQNWHRRREIVTKLYKNFPGPGVPSDCLGLKPIMEH